MHPALEKTFPLTDKEMRLSLLKNRLGEFVFIQEKRKNGYADETSGGVLIPKAAFRDFARFLRDFANDLEHA
jgi:hypothetical protein